MKRILALMAKCRDLESLLGAQLLFLNSVEEVALGELARGEAEDSAEEEDTGFFELVGEFGDGGFDGGVFVEVGGVEEGAVVFGGGGAFFAERGAEVYVDGVFFFGEVEGAVWVEFVAQGERVAFFGGVEGVGFAAEDDGDDSFGAA
jgi:hypothetical protein